jgi:hypothetical protein
MPMKRLAFLALIMLFAAVLASCAKGSSESVEGMINPGDKIGDFLITTGGDEGVTYVSMMHCPFDESAGTEIESCEFPVGTKVNVGIGFIADPSTGKSLDEIWSEHTDKIVIEGRPVNLQAFGSIDIPHPAVGKVRNWNVVIVADKPGKISARSTGEAGGDSFDYTAALTFVAP